MRFIDSHAHLADPAFDSDRDAVIARATAAGAVGIVCIGESLPAAARAREVARLHPNLVFFTAGLHPHDAASADRERDQPMLETELRAGARAVGECGLDYHYDNSPRETQRTVFAWQLDLARQFGLPLVVHTRDAEEDTRAFLADAGRLGVMGVLHCFTGSAALARAALDVGWYVSFSGIVTFRNWKDDDVIRLVPDDRILAESDSPYLAPVPNRGKRNEPAWVAHTVERLAAARETSPESLGVLVTANARRLFALPKSATVALQ
ncbi:MAG TPA: TatD family hydrolase [Gemmatimonadaceae bacterium]|nr:TatD family hydrolase [Gemmatimonadaceae bacterium]